MSGVIPYLIRAYCDWIEDNKLTPYLLVNTNNTGVVVPDGYDANGKMVLNISSSAAIDRIINNETISFKARFQGKSQKIIVPCDAVLSIYAQENGEGMMFDNKTLGQEKNSKKPNLTILD
jgi:stringent starvation protein B